MQEQTEIEEYLKAWLEAERETLILEFNIDNPWSWITRPPESISITEGSR